MKRCAFWFSNAVARRPEASAVPCMHVYICICCQTHANAAEVLAVQQQR